MMKIEVYWVVRQNDSDDCVPRAVAGPFCDQMQAWDAMDVYERDHIMTKDYVNIRAQVIEVE